MRASLDPGGEGRVKQDADPDIGPIMKWKRAWNDRSHDRLRCNGASGNDYIWYAEYCTVGFMSWRDRDGGTSWSFLRTGARSFSNVFTEER